MGFSTVLGVACLGALFATAAEKPAVTFHRDVEPVLQKRCQGCHRPGQVAPMSLLTYQDTRPWAKAMKAAVVQRKMPPWFADPAVGKFHNDARLSVEEITTITAWADQGANQGNPADAPAPLRFTDNWFYGTPDMVVSMPKPFSVPATGVVDYQWVVLPLNFSEDRWVQAMEYMPGNRAVVHHLIAFIRKPGSKWLADLKPGEFAAKAPNASEGGMNDGAFFNYVPGNPGTRLPRGYAMKIPAGADLILQLHYTPNGTATSDQSRIGLSFASAPPEKEVFNVAVITTKLKIPPRDPNYSIEATAPLGRDIELLAMMPHMHLRGKAFQIAAESPDGTRTLLLNVPKYDFNWQLVYQPETPILLAKGSKLWGKAWFDNSPNNPHNPNPDQEVTFGDQTTDEMMVGWMLAAAPRSQPQNQSAGLTPKYGN